MLKAVFIEAPRRNLRQSGFLQAADKVQGGATCAIAILVSK